MEPTLAISIAMCLVIMFGCLYMLKVLGECKKIIKSMKKRSKKYMREVVSK